MLIDSFYNLADAKKPRVKAEPANGGIRITLEDGEGNELAVVLSEAAGREIVRALGSVKADK